MMTTPELAKVKDALEKAGNAWLFDYWDGRLEEVLTGFYKDIQEFIRCYQERFHEPEPPDPFALLQRNPLLGKAFFHVDTLNASVEMKIMIWRILQGCEILRVQFRNEPHEEPYLSITIRTPFGEEDPPYLSNNPFDFYVLRHFAATIVSKKYLILQGYYATKTEAV